MYVGYLLDNKESPATMYPTPAARHSGLSLPPPQNYVPVPAQFSDFAGYHHHVPGLSGESHHHHHPHHHPPTGQQQQQQQQPSGAWGSPYPPPPPPAPKEDWHPYGAAGASNPGPLGYNPAEFNPIQGPGAGLLPPAMGAASVGSISPGGGGPQGRTPYEWMRRSLPTATTTGGSSSSGKTRTKDKYRVVYTDHQRLELEKEFHYSRYITIRRKAELAATLGLTERQVKIWFQNRRAKERKVNKKKMQQQTQPASTTTPTPPAVGTPGPIGGICSSTTNLVSSSPMTIKEEFMP